MELWDYNPRGPLRFCRCTHAWTSILKYTPKHILVMMQNLPHKQGFVGFCLKFDPLNRSESEEFELILTKPPLFPEKWHFRPLNAFPALRILGRKRPLFLVFLFSHVYHNVPECPSGIIIHLQTKDGNWLIEKLSRVWYYDVRLSCILCKQKF